MSIMQDSREATMIGRRSDGTPVRRPLSPHLQVYDMLQMTSALSISNRITGVIWSLGLVLLVWWLLAAASGPEAYATAGWWLSSWLGILVLFGMSAAAWFHTLNGIRHLAWDAGYGYDIPSTYSSGRAVLIGTAIATVLTWLIAIVSWH
ncbi:MAG TPA: succinate dehydrogenase, cytochrome b556 subunit [Crenalkalicoccus sp.]|jgi:succinate dehydrogenase / fumarate reductase cytochrome b subunit|nr:succinate dehydrogenase, cytochrome b556 subunit [Crenalkalicoccus sp.]